MQLSSLCYSVMYIFQNLVEGNTLQKCYNIAQNVPHFLEPLEGARRGFLVEALVDMISCQISTLQFFHMLADPEDYVTSDN